MATLTATNSSVQIFVDGKPIGVAQEAVLTSKMVPVTLGGTYPDGAKARPVDVMAPEHVVAKGAQAVFDWWLEDLKAKQDNA